MTQILIEIPDELISRLQEQKSSVQEIVIKALENYVQAELLDITKTRTWELCGSLEIVQPEPKYIIGQDNRGQVVTNYAENIDEIIY
ncbi:conserved hypothetical protein [Microcystis aeruginosa PCC 9806]|jgi:hypothetical protein|uniref:Uncharacterized protein n=4 Tax=Microcystis TaxID=1125 RepID=S3JW67_MICAE|nr:hypothetical protein [Microcystis aeruginosa]NCR99811.1 hypothetical protein [Microcystis aeruginosa L311-01]OCY13798.1 MAG: hypothetical protein BEV12_22120 [Microcystis aeruginosa CACIAM 03]TRU08248.1 MAG: hypothetical protein EWV59_16460 [Microcystis aeruginosa Ma_MB_F_20061100_S19D]TRU16944.1 MAG: hypothetical protein EWV58_06200 [Microcystis aeruginosa Ma_MB_F_20061100_S19]TRV18757.1 MAG: hypothetical protein EWV40_16670 [Microcystis flos-aquae Mf_WU_F_19750830_S460]